MVRGAKRLALGSGDGLEFKIMKRHLNPPAIISDLFWDAMFHATKFNKKEVIEGYFKFVYRHL